MKPKRKPTTPSPEFLKLSREEQRLDIIRRGAENILSLKALINEAYRACDMNEVAICRALLATAERRHREFLEANAP